MVISFGSVTDANAVGVVDPVALPCDVPAGWAAGVVVGVDVGDEGAALGGVSALADRAGVVTPDTGVEASIVGAVVVVDVSVGWVDVGLLPVVVPAENVEDGVGDAALDAPVSASDCCTKPPLEETVVVGDPFFDVEVVEPVEPLDSVSSTEVTDALAVSLALAGLASGAVEPDPVAPDSPLAAAGDELASRADPSSAWAIPDPPVIAAPTPKVIAPAPSQA